MFTICITGGTGTIGRALSQHLLTKGHRVIVLCRSRPASVIEGVQYVRWNPYRGEIDSEALQEVDYLVHLAGANVAEKRWTKQRKKELVDSRTLSSKTLVEFLSKSPNRMKAVISMSAIGWYGPDRGIVFTENDSPYDDFLGNTCKAWEESISPVSELGKRLVILRTGIVLSKQGGALAEFMKPVRFGIAPILGSGKQMISWIHVDDLCSIFEWAIDNQHVTGIYNAVAPNPVSNKTLMLTLARVLKGRAFLSFPVPAILLKLMLGEMSIEVLKSATASSGKIIRAGFEFKYESVDVALKEIFPKN
jgi:uncharacterized protein (TIGR01777 family)